MSIEGLTSGQIADLTSSGLSQEMIGRMRLRAASGPDLEACSPSLSSREGIDIPYVIPYLTLQGSPTIHYRIKLFRPSAMPEGMKYQKYAQPQNTPNWLYFPPGMYELFMDSRNKYVLLTEGEKKAAACVQAGIPAVGVGGVDSWRSRTFELDIVSMASAGKGSLNGDSGSSETSNKIVVKLASSQSGVKELEHIVAQGMREFGKLVRTTGKTLFIIFDSDRPELPHVRPEVQRAAAELAYYFRAEAKVPMKQVKQLTLPYLDGKTGLDDFLISRKGGLGGLTELIHEAISKPYGETFPIIPDIRDWVAGRLNQGRMNRAMAEKTAMYMLTDLDAHGQRLKAPEQRYFFFDKEKKEVVPALSVGAKEQYVLATSLAQYMYLRFNLQTRDVRIRENFMDAFAAEDPLVKVEPHRGLRVQDGAIDVQVSDNQLLRVTSLDVSLHDNGFDGTLFLSDQVEALHFTEEELRPQTLDLAGQQPCWWLDTLRTLDIEPAEGLTKDETTELVAALFYISPWLNRWKGMQLPLEVACAEAGSGKSSVYALRLSILTGRPELQNVPTDLRDWYAAITEAPGMWVGDNVRFTNKDARQRLSDELCRLITEPDPHVTMRRLYTTAERARIPINSVFALTSIYPPFYSADLGQRSVMIRFKAIPEGQRLSDWPGQQLLGRGGRKAWLLHHLVVLRAFLAAADRQWDATYRSVHRLANFEQGLLLMGRVLGLKSVTASAVHGLTHHMGAVEEDTTIVGLKEFLDEVGKTRPQGFSAGDIVKWASETEDYGQDFMLTNARSLGKYMRAHEYDIQKNLGIVNAGKRANRQMYYWKPPKDV